MKVRLSHVTNSSSSSFVIAVKYFPRTGLENQYPFIKKAIGALEKHLENNRGITKICTPDDVDKYFCDLYACEHDKLVETLYYYDEGEKYIEMMDTLRESKTLYAFSLSSDEPGDLEISNLLSLFLEESWLTVLSGEFGYFRA